MWLVWMIPHGLRPTSGNRKLGILLCSSSWTQKSMYTLNAVCLYSSIDQGFFLTSSQVVFPCQCHLMKSLNLSSKLYSWPRLPSKTHLREENRFNSDVQLSSNSEEKVRRLRWAEVEEAEPGKKRKANFVYGSALSHFFLQRSKISRIEGICLEN